MAIPGSAAGPPGRPAPEPVSWPVVLGLGAFALLVPLTELTGLSRAVGPALAVLVPVAVVATSWIGVVGFARVPRPVLTLTLAGTVSGVVLLLLSLTLGTGPAVDGVVLLLVAVVEITRSTGLGALAGVVAAAIQDRRTRR